LPCDELQERIKDRDSVVDARAASKSGLISNVALEASDPPLRLKVKTPVELVNLSKRFWISVHTAVLVGSELAPSATAFVAKRNAGAVCWLAVVLAVVVFEAAVVVEAAVVIEKPEAMTFDVVAFEAVVALWIEASIAEM